MTQPVVLYHANCADGFGAGMVEQFARQGSKVGFADINAAKGTETLDRCAALEPRHGRLPQLDRRTPTGSGHAM